jgi:formylglycine-generating enzyme required for sulfatase activity
MALNQQVTKKQLSFEKDGQDFTFQVLIGRCRLERSVKSLKNLQDKKFLSILLITIFTIEWGEAGTFAISYDLDTTWEKDVEYNFIAIADDRGDLSFFVSKDNPEEQIRANMYADEVAHFVLQPFGNHSPLPQLMNILYKIKDLYGLKAIEGQTFLGLLKDLYPDLEKPLVNVLKQAVSDQIPQHLFALRYNSVSHQHIELERLRSAFVADNCLDQKAYEVFDLLSGLYFEQQTRNELCQTWCDYWDSANGVIFKMIAIQGGTYRMGDLFNNENVFLHEDDDGFETPVFPQDENRHRVYLENYFIGETPVTQALWHAIMEENPSEFPENSKCPVENVNWHDVQKFIEKLNQVTGRKYRLLTDAEWEYAARERGRKLRFGNGLDIANPNFMNFDPRENHHYSEMGEYRGRTTPVKMFLPNRLGLFDMSGNVREWCSDWYTTMYTEISINPVGPKSGKYRVTRGGSWKNVAQQCRAAARDFSSPDERRPDLGFRLACDL